MSPGSPVTRQRCSQEYVVIVESLVLEDDDPTSKTPRSLMPVVHQARTWYELLVNIAWLISSSFIIYYGDRHSNLVSLLWSDGRINRTALYLGLVGVILNVGLILYNTLNPWSPQKSHEKYEASLSTAPVIVVLGFLSFFLISFALWPIWSFMTIPLLVTLFMSAMVLSPCLMSCTHSLMASEDRFLTPDNLTPAFEKAIKMIT